MNEAILRKFIVEALSEMMSQANPRVGKQLLPKDGGKKKQDKNQETDEDTDEVDEMAGAAAVGAGPAAGGNTIGSGNIAGFTAPLGWSSEDVKGPGAGRRKKKKSSARWK